MSGKRIWIAGTFAIAVLLLSVACGGSQANPTPTPYHLTSTPDASGVIRVPVPHEPAADAGRKDCPANWLAYEEEAYSICYPPDYYAGVWSSAPFPDQRFTVRLISGEPVAQTPNTLTVWQSSTYDPPTDCYFDGEATAVPDKRQMGTFGLGHTTAEGCLTKLGGMTQYSGVIRTAEGQVQYRSQAASEDQVALAKQILATLVVKHLFADQPKFATLQAELLTASRPTATPLVPGPDVRLCRGSDIVTDVNGQGYGGGGMLTSIKLRNVSNTPCQISQAPDIQFLDVDGRVLTINLPTDFPIVPRHLLLLPKVDFEPTGLRGGQVALTLNWHSYSDNATDVCHTVQPDAKQIKLLLAGSDEVIVDTGIAPCGGTVQYQGYEPGYRQ